MHSDVAALENFKEMFKRQVGGRQHVGKRWYLLADIHLRKCQKNNFQLKKRTN